MLERNITFSLAQGDPVSWKWECPVVKRFCLSSNAPGYILYLFDLFPESIKDGGEKHTTMVKGENIDREV